MPLLVHGAKSLHKSARAVESDLANWGGMDHLKRLGKSAFGVTSDADIYLASRSRALMRMGAELMFRICNHCLTLDLGWSSYQCDLQLAAGRVGRRVSELKIRDSVLRDRMSSGQIVDRVADYFKNCQCDGLFLPAVDNHGVRLPVQAIVRRLRDDHRLRFVILDAAQALGHVQLAADSSEADFVIGGTHKWLGSYFPFGMAVAPNPASHYFVRNTIAGCLNRQQTTDGLMSFLRELESNGKFPNPETVDVAALFSSYGALLDASVESDIGKQNADLVAELAQSADWTVVRPVEDLRTAILLAKPPAGGRSNSPDRLREQLAFHQIAATVFDNGVLRLSMPKQLLLQQQIQQLLKFFRAFPRRVAFRSAGLHADKLARVAVG